VPDLPREDFEAIRIAVANALDLTHIQIVPLRDLQDFLSGKPGAAGVMTSQPRP
jgi:hypothetical protein